MKISVYFTLLALAFCLTACSQKQKPKPVEENQSVVEETEYHLPFKKLCYIQCIPAGRGYKPMEMFFDFNPPRAFVRYAKGDDITVVYPDSGYSRLDGGMEFMFDEVINGQITGRYTVLEGVSVTYTDKNGKAFPYNITYYTLKETSFVSEKEGDFEYYVSRLHPKDDAMLRNIPPSIRNLVPSGYEIRALVYGNLNRDSYQDAIIVLSLKGRDEICSICLLAGDSNHAFKVVAKNNPKPDSPFAAWDTFYGIAVKNGYFSIEHRGRQWIHIVTFRFSEDAGTWLACREDDTTDYGTVHKYITKYVADIPFEKYEPKE
jgi:hypothetical protein